MVVFDCGGKVWCVSGWLKVSGLRVGDDYDMWVVECGWMDG